MASKRFRRLARMMLAVVVVTVVIGMMPCVAFAGKSSGSSGNGFKLERLATTSAFEFDDDIAIAAAELSAKANSWLALDIEKEMRDLGLKKVVAKNYLDRATMRDGFSAAVTFGMKNSKVDGITYVVVVTRGTQTSREKIGDWLKGDPQPFLNTEIYDNAYDYEQTVQTLLEEYAKDNGLDKTSQRLVFLVCGHSLGGACASAVGAKLTHEINGDEWWSKKTKQEDIHVYTFGGIKVITSDEDISDGYENIHNVYNEYDSFGPRGNLSFLNVSLPGAKFGHVDMFHYEETEIGLSANGHDINLYHSAVMDHRDNDAQNYHLKTCSDKKEDAVKASLFGDGWYFRMPKYWRDEVSVEKSSTTFGGEKLTQYDILCNDIHSTRDDKPVSILQIKEFPSQNAAKHLLYGDAEPKATATLKSGQEVSIYTSEMGYEMLVPVSSTCELVIYTGWQTAQGALYSKDTDLFHSKVLAYADLQSFGAVTSFDDYGMDTCLDCLVRVAEECVTVDRVFDCDGFTFTMPAALLACDGVTCEENGGWPLIKQDNMTLLWFEKNQSYWDQAGAGHVSETRKLSNGTLQLAGGDDVSILACLSSSDGKRVVFGSFVFGDKKAQELGSQLTDACRLSQATTCNMSAKEDAKKIAAEFMATIAKGITFGETGTPEPEQSGESVSLGGYTFDLPAYWDDKVEIAYDKSSKFMRADQNATVCMKGTDNAILCLSYKQDYAGRTWASPAVWAEDSSRVEYTAAGAIAWVGLDSGGAIGIFVPSKWFSISRLEAGGYSDDGPDGYDSQEVTNAVADLQGLGTGARSEELMRTVMATARTE